MFSRGPEIHHLIQNLQRINRFLQPSQRNCSSSPKRSVPLGAGSLGPLSIAGLP